MNLIVWCGSDTKTIKDVIGPVIRLWGVPHKVVPITDTLPDVEEGDVVLGFGTKAINVLTGLGTIPKNRTITSLREKEMKIGGVSYFLTFDPGIVTRDYARLPDIQWDIQLAIRVLKTGTTRPKIGDYSYVESLHEMIEWIELEYERTQRPVDVACDLETLGLDEYAPDAYIISVSFTAKEGTAEVVYFEKGEVPVPPSPWATPEEYSYWEGLWEQLNWLLTSPKVSTRGANFKYDSRWITKHWEIQCTNQKFDTLLVGSLLDENRSNSLKLHAKLFTAMGGYEDDAKQYDFSRVDLIPKDVLLPYAGGDTDVTHQVARYMKNELTKDRALTNFYVKLLQPSVKVFEKLERTGVLVDLPYYRSLEQELTHEITRLANGMVDMLPNKLRIKHMDSIEEAIASGKTPMKPSLLKEFLFTKAGLGLKPMLTTEKTGEPSTSGDHLMMFMDDPVAAKFVEMFKEYTSATKTMSTYVVGFLKHLRSDGRFHPTYLLGRQDYGGDASGTVTGRLSAKDPVQCLTGDAKVLTDAGEITILDLVTRYKNGEDFKVLTHTGKWQRIIGVFNNGKQPVFNVSSGRARITSTANHPVLTARGWVRTDSLVVGDTVYELRAQNSEVYQPNLLQLVSNEEQMQQPDKQGLGTLRGQGHNGVRQVVGVQELSGGHGGEAGSWVVHREAGRELGVLQGELCLGDPKETGFQSNQHKINNPQRGDQDRGSVGDGRGYYTREAALPVIEGDSNGVSLDEGESIELGIFQETTITGIESAGEALTYDITVEGSHSFVANGMVVHNTIPKHTKWTKRLRRAFVPPEGYDILQLDYSQGELRIAACVAEEPTMIAAYQGGADLHAITAAQLNGYSLEEFMAIEESLRDELRSSGKAGNFGLLYGMQHKGFKEYAYTSYGVKMTEEEAFIKRTAFFDLYHRLLDWHDESKAFAHKHEMVRSPLGRIRHLPLINVRDRETVAKQERQSINSPIQATLSDMMQLAMVHMDREYGEQDIHMFMMTHDAVALYVPQHETVKWAKNCKEIMENLPLQRDFGWSPALKFIADAECTTPDDNGIRSFSVSKKLKNL